MIILWYNIHRNIRKIGDLINVKIKFNKTTRYCY